MVRVPSEDHLLELDDGRTVGYATWGHPKGRQCSSAAVCRDRVWTNTWPSTTPSGFAGGACASWE